MAPVAGQARFGEELSEQHAVCHVFEHGSLWCAVLKTNAVTHLDDSKTLNFSLLEGAVTHQVLV